MARKDKVLEVMALSGLPENARIARLAHMRLGKLPTMEHARAVINCYFEQRGRTQELTEKLFHEAVRQEKLRSDREAYRAASEKRDRPITERYPAGSQARKQRAMEIALRAFGNAVRENFNEDSLALMSLISGEDRWYQVRWLDAGFRPVLSTLISVVTMCPKGRALYNYFLLYRVKGRVLVARTNFTTLQQAWGSQLPETFVAAAPILREQGYTFSNDLEDQSMVVVAPDGSEFRRVPWEGRTADE